MLPPVVPPVSLYANLPQEWPLARLSVQVRHISVLLRVTLYRRVAELNFRGVDFRALPREVMRNIVNDFNNIGGDLARRLASLFAFLKPDPSAGTQADTLGLALYADPAYWLYGLLSYCAKACESKIEETNGVPVWKAKEEGGTPDIEATGKTLALTQTVVMSFGCNQSLGKPDLPIHHIHVYFPVQFVHKLGHKTSSCCDGELDLSGLSCCRGRGGGSLLIVRVHIPQKYCSGLCFHTTIRKWLPRQDPPHPDGIFLSGLVLLRKSFKGLCRHEVGHFNTLGC